MKPLEVILGRALTGNHSTDFDDQLQEAAKRGESEHDADKDQDIER